MRQSTDQNRPLIIAHRGASCEAPENTLPAFQKAIEIGADWIECDVHFTADGYPVVIHDNFLERLAGLLEKVHHLPLSEVRKLDVGSWFHSQFKGEKIPLLQEVFQLCAGRIGMMIEVKTDDRPIDLLAKWMANYFRGLEILPSAEILVGSFSAPFLAAFHSLCPQIPLIGIAENLKEKNEHLLPPQKNLALDAKLVHPNIQPVWSFTIDCPIEAMRLTLAGVSGLITNDPRKLIARFATTSPS